MAVEALGEDSRSNRGTRSVKAVTADSSSQQRPAPGGRPVPCRLAWAPCKGMDGCAATDYAPATIQTGTVQ